MSTYAYRQAAGIRQALLDRRELALIDVREEADFATAHPLFAVNLPLNKLELEVLAGGYRASPPADRLRQRRGSGGDRRRTAAVLGLSGCGPAGQGSCWLALSGGELFQDVTLPVKPLVSWWKACVTHRRSAPRRFRR